jgi:hypothetical protein
MNFPRHKFNIFTKIKYRALHVWDLIIYDIPYFFKNFWRFKKELWRYREWDYNFVLKMWRTSLFYLCEYIDKEGLEINETRIKKVYYMKRALFLMDCIINDTFVEAAEKELGYELSPASFEFEPIERNGETWYSLINNKTPEEQEKDTQINNRADLIEKETWGELMDILEGNHFKIDFLTNPWLRDQSYEEFMDGKGMINWWD